MERIQEAIWSSVFGWSNQKVGYLEGMSEEGKKRLRCAVAGQTRSVSELAPA